MGWPAIWRVLFLRTILEGSASGDPLGDRRRCGSGWCGRTLPPGEQRESSKLPVWWRRRESNLDSDEPPKSLGKPLNHRWFDCPTSPPQRRQKAREGPVLCPACVRGVSEIGRGVRVALPCPPFAEPTFLTSCPPRVRLVRSEQGQPIRSAIPGGREAPGPTWTSAQATAETITKPCPPPHRPLQGTLSGLLPMPRERTVSGGPPRPAGE